VSLHPPAESWAHVPTEQTLTLAYHVFSEKIGSVEMLISPEEGAFVTTDDLERDVLSIVAVHPMREAVLLRTLEAKNADITLIDRLVREHRITRTTYGGTVFYIRNLHQN
jgi:wyosine [tRNA(Phe)-imidazoG37] synthetase (radical SAM superfamily)